MIPVSPLWYQATSGLDILHPVLKFGVLCTRVLCETGPVLKLCEAGVLKLVSRARTSCLCAEAVVAQSLCLCPVCEDFFFHI